MFDDFQNVMFLLLETQKADSSHCPLEPTETKERLVANLANFSYDPYNYSFLRQVLNLYS